MNLLVQLGLCAALATVVLAAGITRTVVVSWDARRNMLRAHNDTAAKDIIAVCVLQDARMDFGWASVYVKTDSRYRDSQQAYAAGFAEGAATSSMTDEQFANVYAHYCDPDPAFCEGLFAFYHANLRSMFDNAVRYSDHDPFWHQVELALLQISGMQRGLSRATAIPYEPYKLPQDIERLILLNLYKDIGDLEWAFKKRGPRAPRDLGVAFFKMGRDNSEALASHATWGHYANMNKLLKKYEFHYGLLPGSGHPVWSTVVTFSGYPGSISSGDDFYLTATNLAILGTGVRNQNDNLWSRVSPDNSVPSAFRSLAACRLARTAQEWLQIYSKSSSGTFNNFEHDPLAVCPECDPKYNAENALSARSDLSPPTGKYPFLEMEHRPHGGTDAKEPSVAEQALIRLPRVSLEDSPVPDGCPEKPEAQDKKDCSACCLLCCSRAHCKTPTISF
ncbi:putative phospholipase B-like 2 isoform X4 [Haemaphysalis longicornis]